MKKIITPFILYFFVNFYAYSQTGELAIIFDTNQENIIISEPTPVKISNTTNIDLSGSLNATDYVSIIPNSLSSIVLKPLSTTARIINPNGDVTTVVRPKPPGGGLPAPRKLIIFPNPVQTNLTYTVDSSLVNSYSIYNSMGILQNSQTVNPPVSSGTINVAGLINGTYILKLNIGNGQQLSIQFIKN
jgi:Secretion system C-terminal sorting domain